MGEKIKQDSNIYKFFKDKMTKIAILNSNMQISWLTFVLLNAGFLTLMNFYLFGYIFSKLPSNYDNFLMKCVFVTILFCGFVALFSIIFLPFITKILSIIFILIACVSSYFMQKYGSIIDMEIIQSALKTDSREVSEITNIWLILWVFFFGILPCVLVIKTKINYLALNLSAARDSKKSLIYRILKHLSFRFATFILSLGLLIALFYPLSKFLVPFFRNYYQAEFYATPYFQIKSLVRYIKHNVLPQKEFSHISMDAKINDFATPKLLIMVIGETARAKNFSLGGYSKNETNHFTKNQDIVYFSNFSSCGTLTARSVPCMFSKHNRANFSGRENEENVLDVLQRVGVNVSWLGNNSGGCQGQCARINDVKTFVEDYDGFLVDVLKEKLASLDSKISKTSQDSIESTLIVLHLQGSHGPTYYKRYPNEFKKFTPTCDTNELSTCSFVEISNTYDNTLFYTDYILSQIIDLAKQQNKKYGINAAVIYMSDHGESLGENGIYLHGMPYMLAPKEQTSIPAIIYSSNSKQMQNLDSNKNLPLSHDNLFSTLLGFFGVDTSDYKSSYDLFSPNLKGNF